MRLKRRLLVLATCVPLVSCSTLQQHQGALIGCGVGTLVGGIVGNQIAGKKGRNVGAVLGAGVGCAVGIQWDKRRKDLAEAAQRNQLDIEFEAIQTRNTEAAQKTAASDAPPAAITDDQANGLLATIRTPALFAENSDQLSASAKAGLWDIARQYQGSTQKILIIGHTDSQGDATANMQLSERRAKNVALVFRDAGLDLNNLFYQGAGESQPVASNNGAQGRALNRRVEILEVDSEESLLVHSLTRKTSLLNLQFSVKEQPAPKGPPKKPAAHNNPLATKKTAKKSVVARPPKAASVTVAKPNINTKTTPHTEAQPQPQTNSTSQQASSLKPKTPTNFIDFGGYPVNQLNLQDLLGRLKPKKDSSFSILSSAYASSSLPAGRCTQDEARVSGDVHSLKDGSTHKYKTADFLPGLYRVPWYNRVNGHLVSLSPVSVLRSEAQVVDFPVLKIFANYQAGQQQADLVLSTQVNTYDAQDNLLYRVFIERSNELQCMDLVLPKAAPFQAQTGYLFYQDEQGQTLVADFRPQLVQ